MNKFLVRVIKWAIGISILVFMVLYFIKNFSQVPWGEISFNPILLTFAIAVLFIDHLFFAKIWEIIIRSLGYPISFFKAGKVFFVSLLGRYVPGKAMLLISRIYLAKKVGVSRRATFSSLIIESFLALLSAFICFIVPLFLLEDLPRWLIIIPLIFIPIILILLIPSVFSKFTKILFKLAKKDNIEFKVSYSHVLKILFLFIVRWILTGIAMFILIRSIVDVPFDLLFLMPGIVGMSTMIGMISFISPGGLGVREGIMVLLLAYFMPSGLAVMFSFISRIAYLGMEVLMAGLFSTKH